MRHVVVLLCAAAILGVAVRPWSVSGVPRAEQVVLRLGPADFGAGAGAPHVPVERIGMEAREVVVDRRPVEVARIGPIAMSGTPLSLPVVLPEAVRRLPDGAFVLSLRRELTTPPAAAVPGHYVFEEVAEGWSLTRDPRDPAAAVLHVNPRQPPGRAVLRLEALAPFPDRLESRVFDPPAGSRLEISWGLRWMPRARGIVSFAATLACAGEPPRVLVRRTVSAADRARARWHDEACEIPRGARACRLVLETSSALGDITRAVWGVPRFLVREPLEHDVQRVVLISLDTLRADHLSAYGYGRSTSPRMDAALFARGTTFTDVTTTFPMTNHAHASLFTGLLPAAPRGTGTIRRDTRVRLLAEVLQQGGFETVAFTEGGLVSGEYGFWFGIDRLRERTMRSNDLAHGTFADAAAYLRAHPDRRSFLFLHTYKTHAPYLPRAEYRLLFHTTPGVPAGRSPFVPPRHRLDMDQYDRVIRETDDVVGRFLDELDALGIAGRTLVVLLSDHGEAFGEHHVVGHGVGGHQEQLRVPLVFRGPGVPAGLRVATPVSLVDVAPTLLALLRQPPLPRQHGISLAGAFTGAPLPPERPLGFAWLPDRRGVRVGRWKFLDVPHGLLYDLGADAAERTPRRDRADLIDEARTALSSLEAASRPSGASGGQQQAADGAVGLSEETARALRALGYVP